jgi:hypothetical protein
MTYFLIISCVVSGWAMLRLMGSERTQMIKELEADLRKQQELEQQNSPPPAETAEPLPAATPPKAAAPKPAPPKPTVPAKAPAATKSKH